MFLFFSYISDDKKFCHAHFLAYLCAAKQENYMNFSIKHPANEGGMNERIKRLRQQNFDTPTTLSIERALIETAFYKEHYGHYSFIF